MKGSNPGKTTLRALLAAGVMTSLGAGSANAAEWQHTLTPYLWGSSMNGETTVATGLGPLTADIDMSFSEILDNLDMGGMLAYKGVYGNWVLMGDFVYMDLGARETHAGPVAVDAALDVSQTAFEADLGYRVTEETALFVGARFMDINADVQVITGGTPGSTRTGGASASWVDPVVGVAGEYGLTQRWAVNLKADIGGFDVGSEFTWQVMASLRYRATEHLDIAAGYRYFAVDYEDEGSDGVIAYDMIIAGPGIGFSFRF